MNHQIEATLTLLSHYKKTWQHFWAERQHLTPPSLHADEAAFLPAALAITRTPVSPVGRTIGWLLMGIVLTLLLWSFFGKFDIVVNAQGKIIPSDRTKTITAIETASVRAVHVADGQRVKAGDVLIDLDRRGSDAEAEKAKGEATTAALEAARSAAILMALDTGVLPDLPNIQNAPNVPPISPERLASASSHLRDQWQDFVAKRARLDGEISRFSGALPLAAQRARDYKELAKTNDVSTHAYLEKEQQRLDVAGQLTDAQHQKAALIAETRNLAQERLNEALRLLAASNQDAHRATAHGEQLRLVSPIDGTVQQLSAHTVGAAVPAAQPLMQIVPTGGKVEMEAFIDNKDVGFVREGQEAAVKIDAFLYTKYGTVPAMVTHVSRDAIVDEKRGLIYAVKVELLDHQMNIDGKKIPLSAGMSGSVEIKTGDRRVIEYLLSPILVHGRESFSER